MSQDNAHAQRLEAALITREKKDLQSRIKALFTSGRITKPIQDKLLQDCGTVRMSLDDSGTLASNSVLAKVEAYEDLREGAAWPNDGTLPPDVQAAPENPGWGGHGEHQSREQVTSTVDNFFEMLPGGAPSRKAA